MGDFLRELANLEKRTIDNHNSNVGHINKLYQHQSKEIQNEQINAIKEITAYSFSKAAAYTNVIIIAGYVAFFSIWNHVKDILPEKAMIAAALLITLSVLIFVLFEIYKMIVNGLYFRKASMAFRDNKDPLLIIQNVQKQSSDFDLQNARIWLFALIPSLLFGMSAAAILLFYFLKNL